MRTTRTLAVVCVVVSALTACSADSPETSGAEPRATTASAIAPGATAIYDDALASGWSVVVSGATQNAAATSPVYTGTRAVAITYQASGGVLFRRSAGPVSGVASLQLAVRSATASPRLSVVGVRGSTVGTRVDLAAYCAGGAIPAGAWTLCTVPLSALGAAGATFDGFGVQEGAGRALSGITFDELQLLPAPTLPAAPTGLTAGASASAVALSWSGCTGATGYDVYRATSSGGAFTKLTAAPQAGTAYGDAAVSAGSSYWYQVRAVNAVGAGPASATVSATVPAAQGTVTVSLAPVPSTIDACATLRFTATVSGAADTSVTWSVQEGAAGGTIDSAGNYTAPSTGVTAHVVATSRASPSVSATATLTVQERIVAIQVAPTSLQVLAGGQGQLQATVTTSCGTFPVQ